MNAKAKIRLDSIEQAHRALEALPEHRPEELTKTQAIQRLIAPIRASQAKGYSLAAIGKVLSDCGIPITTGALRAYVNDATAGEGRKRKPRAKRAATSPMEAASGAVKGRQEIAAAQTAKRAAAPTARATPGGVDLDWEPAAPINDAAALPASAPRGSFHVRADTKDI